MRLRMGRLGAGYFKDLGSSVDHKLRWGSTIYCRTGVLPDVLWFSVDNATGIAALVNTADVNGNVVWELAGFLEGEEAVALVTEEGFRPYLEQRQWQPTEADGPFYVPPPRAITGGMLSYGTLQIPLRDVASMASHLVVARRIYMLGRASSLSMGRLEVVPAEAVPALFADD